MKKFFGNKIEVDYLDGFQYKSTFDIESWNGEGSYIQDPNEIPVVKLRIIPTSEGYYDALKQQYIYNFTDHLGNVRLSYSDTNKDGIIQPIDYEVNECIPKMGCVNKWKSGEIIDVNNYYPFGLLHNYTVTSTQVYQYKYNGKELEETGMYDYGARFYMPDLGRWGVVDPLAETSRRFSPYTYAFNNPINFIDPDGREGEGWGLKDGQWNFVQGMQQGDATYQQGGYSNFAADGSTVENASINGGESGAVYLGYGANDVAYSENNFTNWNNLHGGNYETRNEAYLAWQSNSGYHKGESFWDRTFRTMGFAFREAKMDMADGLMFAGSGGSALKTIEASEKLSLAAQISAEAEANGIKSAQKGINPAKVAEYFEQM